MKIEILISFLCLIAVAHASGGSCSCTKPLCSCANSPCSQSSCYTSIGDTLKQNKKLKEGQMLTSNSGGKNYYAVMQ